MDILSAKVRDGGISGRQIINVAKETLHAKISNKTQMFIVSYYQFILMIFKYLIRTKILSKWKILN
jgi:hypothetical protein